MTWWEWVLLALLLASAWTSRHHHFILEHILEGSPMARLHQLPSRGDDTFDAGTFGTLRYDFKAHGGVQGRIPDPSDELIEQFMQKLREIAREFGDDELENVNVDELNAEEINELLADDKNLQIAEAQRAICEAIGELCQGSPSADQLLALPLRVRQGFNVWLQRKLFSGEASAADTQPAQARRIGG